MLSLDDVLRGVGNGQLAYPVDPAVIFRDVTNDSRQVGEGDLFIALRGERDGHEFIPDAFRRGARGALAERSGDLTWLPVEERERFAYIVVGDSLRGLQNLATYWLRQHTVDVVAITGSVGKTTTKELVAAVLGQRWAVLKNERNLNNEIGLPLTVLRLQPEHRRAVLEMGMYALGEIATLCRIAPPRIGVVTNVGPTHLERLGSIERIAEAKSELVAALPRDGHAVLNGDDPLVAAMAGLGPATALRYGRGPNCDLRATGVTSHGLRGISITIEYRGATLRAASPMPGKHSMYACLAAAAVGLVEGLSWPEIEAGLAAGAQFARISALPGREGATIIDDTYNASPASVIAALELLAELPGRHIAILGDMFELGGYEEEGHREVGRHAANWVDKLIVVGERARWIGEEAQAAGLRDVTFAASKAEIAPELQPGDHVLVKGSRGMYMEEVVARLRLPGGEAGGVAER